MGEWVALTQDHTPVPPEWGQGGRTTLSRSEWNGVFQKLEPLLSNCTSIEKVGRRRLTTCFKMGVGIPQRHGGCLILGSPSRLTRVFGLDWLKFSPRGGKGKGSLSRGYYRVKPNGLLSNTQGIYLHRLLRWMYGGPPGDDCFVDTSHVCEHKCCICPWHMRFASRSENVQGAWDRKKRRK